MVDSSTQKHTFMFCVYCNRECNHTSLQHKCKNCNKVGHTTSYCKAFAKNYFTDKFYLNHECVKKTGRACDQCTGYLKQTYIYDHSHTYSLQKHLETCIYLYSEQKELDITLEDVPKLTVKKLVKYINIANKLSAKKYGRVHNDQTYEDMTEDCEACEGDCSGCGICGTCLNGHCICNAVFYLRGECVAKSQ